MSQPAKPANSDDEQLSSDLSSLNLSSSSSATAATTATTPAPSTALLPSFTVDAIADLIRSSAAKNIVVLTGAGISVSSGIPDFRSPGTGLYDNLQRFNLPDPQAIFTLSYFRRHPQPFITLARELYPTLFTPSPAHHFINLLHRRGVLLRCYTQNIDGLEYLAELPHDKLVQAHGGFHSSHCIDCDADVPAAVNKADIMAGRITHCTHCNGLVKPRIVFFGESLPYEFHSGIYADFPKCDLLLCMGTSLTVQPFASLIDRVGDSVPRLLINNEPVGKGSMDEYDSDDEEQEDEMLQQLLGQLNMSAASISPATLAALKDKVRRLQRDSGGFKYHLPTNRRDVFLQSDCDGGVRRLCDALGWRQELEEMVRNGYKGGAGVHEGESVEGKGAEQVQREEAEAVAGEQQAREAGRKDDKTAEEGVMRHSNVADSSGETTESAKL